MGLEEAGQRVVVQGPDSGAGVQALVLPFSRFGLKCLI